MAMPDIELAHDVEETPHHRRLAVLVGVAAIIAAALGVLQMHSGNEEGEANARSARLTAEISRGLQIEGLVGSFQLPTGQQVLTEGIAGTARTIAALNANVAPDVARAASDAENAAVDRLLAIIDAMAAEPGPESGVDAQTRETMARELADYQALTEEQNRVVERAEQYGRRGNRSVLALSIVAVAAVLLGLAGIVGAGRAGSIVLVAATVAILASAGTGISALLIN